VAKISDEEKAALFREALRAAAEKRQFMIGKLAQIAETQPEIVHILTAWLEASPPVQRAVQALLDPDALSDRELAAVIILTGADKEEEPPETAPAQG
jgi:hypothetical protein